MVLFLIGLGLGNERDITLRGLDAIKRCEKVYLEAYTSVLGVDKAKLEELYGKPVELADRECVEQGVDAILDAAVTQDVAFLVVGDPFAATTHTDLQLRARHKGAAVHVIHNASIMNAVAACGLQLYRFGQAVSLCFFTQTWRPDSFYDRVASNRRDGLHTLCLLDIKVREPTEESLARGRLVYMPPRYMTANYAARQLLEVERKRGGNAYGPGTWCVAVARLGQEDQRIVYATLAQMAAVVASVGAGGGDDGDGEEEAVTPDVIDLGPPLHSLVLVGDTHPLEDEVLREMYMWQAA